MGIVGQPKRYFKKFNFGVEIEGFEVAWFETVSSIEAEVGLVEQHEAGLLEVADQSPGKVKWSEVTMTIGATNNRELYDWFLLVVDSASNAGQVDEKYKKNVSIVAKDRDGSVRRRWNLAKAWPRKYKAGEFDAKAEENVIEEVTLVYLRATMS